MALVKSKYKTLPPTHAHTMLLLSVILLLVFFPRALPSFSLLVSPRALF